MKLLIDGPTARTDRKAPLVPFRMFEGRAHLAKDGKLSFPSSQHNISTFLQYCPDAIIENVAPLQFDAYSPRKPRPKFEPRREGRWWQEQATQKIQKIIDTPEMARGFAFFYSPGGGKSKSLTDMAMMLWCAGEIDACIISPPNLLVAEQWVSDDGALSTDVQIDAEYSSWIWGKTKKAYLDYEDLKKSEGCQFISMNIDAFKTPSGEKLLNDFISHHNGRVLLAIDESQKIKTPSSGRHKTMLEFGGKCDWRAILTGTPISKNLVDAWAQFRFLSEKIIGIRYSSAFKNRFCIQKFNGFANEVVGHKNVDEFYNIIDPYCVRVSKAEMGLSKVRDRFEFRLEGEQKRHFDEVKKRWLTSLDSGEFASASIALSAATKMHQIASGFLKTDDGKIHFFEKNARITALEALLETLDDEKLVLWCRFLPNAQQLMQHFGNRAIEISGNIDKRLKTANKERFMSEPDLRFLVATPDSAGVGMDGLQHVCDRAIFFNTNENFIDREQAEDRILRLNGGSTAFYHDLVAKGTGDMKVLRNLIQKRTISAMSLDEVRGIFEDD